MKNNKVNFETIMFLISSSLLLNCFCGYIAYISSVVYFMILMGVQ